MEPFDFDSRANADYIEQLHQQYLKDPRSVSENWRAFFAGFEMGYGRSSSPPVQTGVAPAGSTGPTVLPLTMGVFDLVHSYRELGHKIARLNPLGGNRTSHPLLELSNFGMSEADLDKTVGTGSFLGKTDGTLRDLLDKLKRTYCGTLGVEFIGISNKEQRDWLTAQMEPIYNQPSFSPEQQKSILFQLIASEEFEQYLHRVFIGAKRFSIEGAESMVPLLNTMIEDGAALGGKQWILGMAHRGRLGTLAHVLNKPYESLLGEFFGTNKPNEPDNADGDVKYHLGFANTIPVRDGLTVKVSLLPNPSHLELINPIMQGIIRAKQEMLGDDSRRQVVPVCIHGDAAFTGQGIVAETLNLSELPGFDNGGTLHLIVNNQIGFTTPPWQGRFTAYPTDIARAIEAPIFHVNGDDPHAVVWAAKLAVAFRQKFCCDVIIDLWCYRKHGHNEQDEPDFTQPVMYRQIRSHKSVREQYARRLIDQGILTEAAVEAMTAEVVKRLDAARDLAREVRPRVKVPSFGGAWKGLGRAGSDWSADTKVSAAALSRTADGLRNLPEGFTPHPKIAKVFIPDRIAMVEGRKPIDWGCAEMMAMGTLLTEGYSVRLTGQDVERGTFSHRHAVLHDYETDATYLPLSRLLNGRNRLTVINSMLSEFAVLGFEWGYASADPRTLVMWEAQFGDFVNGAQPIIDQIITASESKWRYMNGLVLLLPHGHEGQGPEHSNAYIERFLSMCAEDNMQVCMLSTPAQYFHALRRQMLRKFRKPLVLMQPKSMLRDPKRASELSEFTEGGFRTVIDDPQVTDPERVRRILITSGKMYYLLRDVREESPDRDELAIIRLEQFYPFPEKELAEVLRRYPRQQEVSWVQEETQNRGAWTFLEPRLRTILPDRIIGYIGRDAAASPATGSTEEHKREERALVEHAMRLKGPSSAKPDASGSPGKVAATH
jgi:2-oxoglutarate dehydrogenase E1 component